MPARRIVSLVPSQTELLYDLGLDQEVVGITKFCIHPEHWRHRKTIVGGTKNVDIKAVDSLQPDLIIGNKEENIKSDIDQLSRHKVWISDVSELESAYKMIESIGELTGTEAKAASIVYEIRESFSSLPIFERKRALYLIWKKPWMAAGNDTFINEMMTKAGLINVISEPRYPKLSSLDLDVETVLLSTEPYPFKEQHVEEIQKLLPKAKVILVNGEMFSWYGSRMRMMPDYFTRFVRPLLD